MCMACNARHFVWLQLLQIGRTSADQLEVGGRCTATLGLNAVQVPCVSSTQLPLVCTRRTMLAHITLLLVQAVPTAGCTSPGICAD